MVGGGRPVGLPGSSKAGLGGVRRQVNCPESQGQRAVSGKRGRCQAKRIAKGRSKHVRVQGNENRDESEACRVAVGQFRESGSRRGPHWKVLYAE